MKATQVAAPAAWRAAQVLGLLLTLGLLSGLWFAPELSLRILWYAVIPILPAVFLLQPGIWRNVCPLGTLNVLGGHWGRRKLSDRWLPAATAIGAVLLLVLVPARRFMFNTDGQALALVIAAVAVLALVGGLLFDRKAGFCNAICPVLPVERLYGQAPLLNVRNAHCAACSVCTQRACLDLTRRKSIPQLLGNRRRSLTWLHHPYGVFAAGFPGFVVGYSIVPDGPLSSAASVYLTVLLAAAISYAASYAIFRVLKVNVSVALTVLGALALGLYYWFAAGSVTTAWQLWDGTAVAIRLAAFSLIGFWLWGLRPSRQLSFHWATRR
jgi:nitrite reductase (NADH) large subunit